MKRPLDDDLRAAILEAASAREDQLPFRAEFEWQPHEPILKFKSNVLPLYAAFDSGRIAIHAKLSLATRMLVTEGNRRKAIRFIEEIADELDL